VLVSGTDGVGTKLKLAFMLDKHDTIGIDCVAMCVNDVVCVGAKPLYFLDYIACGKNVPERIEQIVAGVCEGCVQAGAALIGGETAEMPGFYPINEYDLAGYCTGIVDKDKIIDNSRMTEGDIIIALPSSGVHSNGFSLVRRVFALDKPDIMAMKAGNTELEGKALGDVLLEPTKIYVKPVLALIDKLGAEKIKGISHITGGGFYENIPRSIPGGLTARIARKAIRVLPIFNLIQKVGVISDHDMFNTFNMGVGMTVIVSREDAPAALNILRQNGEDAYVIGDIIRGLEKITIE
jgi:phosphoribosylformylglycinamidine cyclo-ligase